MAEFDWDIPPSTIKNNREWRKKIHSGCWCACYDVERGGKKIRIVHRASSDPGRLAGDIARNPPLYLVGPGGERMDN